MWIQNIISEVTRFPIAMQQEALDEFVSVLEYKASTGVVPAPEYLTQGLEVYAEKDLGISTMKITGKLLHRKFESASQSGATSYEQIGQSLQQLYDDKAVKGRLMSVDSPGGTSQGIQELATLIQNSPKPIMVHSRGLLCSAAYWIASSANKIIANPDSSRIGSIGVIQLHVDHSKHLEKEGINITTIKAGKFKDEASPLRPLTNEERNKLQSQADLLHDQFVTSVAKNRGLDTNKRMEWGEAQVFDASQALELGLIDGVGTELDAINELTQLINQNQSSEANMYTRTSNPNMETTMSESPLTNVSDQAAKITRLETENQSLRTENTELKTQVSSLQAFEQGVLAEQQKEKQEVLASLQSSQMYSAAEIAIFQEAPLAHLKSLQKECIQHQVELDAKQAKPENAPIVPPQSSGGATFVAGVRAVGTDSGEDPYIRRLEATKGKNKGELN